MRGRNDFVIRSPVACSLEKLLKTSRTFPDGQKDRPRLSGLEEVVSNPRTAECLNNRTEGQQGQQASDPGTCETPGDHWGGGAREKTGLLASRRMRASNIVIQTFVICVT